MPRPDADVRRGPRAMATSAPARRESLCHPDVGGKPDVVSQACRDTRGHLENVGASPENVSVSGCRLASASKPMAAEPLRREAFLEESGRGGHPLSSQFLLSVKRVPIREEVGIWRLSGNPRLPAGRSWALVPRSRRWDPAPQHRNPHQSLGNRQ